MAKRTGLRGKSERTQLSDERLDLIHRFMSERPEDAERNVSSDAGVRAVRAEPPAAVPPAPSPAPVQDLAPAELPRYGERYGWRPHVAVPSTRGHVELAWLIAAVILALLVGVLMAHSA
jgi:hypothetical protein